MLLVEKLFVTALLLLLDKLTGCISLFACWSRFSLLINPWSRSWFSFSLSSSSSSTTC